MSEIGSEFEYIDTNYKNGVQLPKEKSFKYVFSGRTAIETVLMNEKSINHALLPSYCCTSMVEPFRKAGIRVDFYPVNYKGLKLQVELKISRGVDCILWCNFFGFSVLMPDLGEFLERGGIVIEDITHSLYSKKTFNCQSHYLVASLRKWEAIYCGGYCVSRIGDLPSGLNSAPSEEFLAQKKMAMYLKRRYIEGDTTIPKQEFLSLFSETNQWLTEHYSNMAIDTESLCYFQHVDYETHRKQRIKNAKVLYQGLKNHPDIVFLFSNKDMDCPLFVPVIIPNGKRDEIRKKLIDYEIYCPVHWPKPDIKCVSNLYDIELSLVCDHRYKEEDMQRIVDVLWKMKEEE